MKTDKAKDDPDEQGECMIVDKDFAQLIVATYCHNHKLKTQLTALPYYQSTELFAGSNAITCLLNNTIEDVPAPTALQSIASGITLTQHLIQVNSSIKGTTPEITNSLRAILTDFQLLQSNISFKAK